MSYIAIDTYDADETDPVLKKIEEHETSVKRLIIYGSIIVSPALLGGMGLSYSAIALPQMQLSISDASWFGSMFNFGSPIGSILTGLIIDKFGRRPSIMISVIPSVLGWLLLLLDFQRTITFSGRILTGVNSGCMYISQVYAAECIVVNHPHWRNSLNVWQGIALSLGMILTYALGCLLPYRYVAAAAAVFSFLLLLINYLYIPESPQWLYHKGLIKEAKRSEKLLGIHQPILKDIDSIETPSCSSKTSHFITVIRKLMRKDVYKPLLVMTMLYTMIMFSGAPAFTAYMVDIITVGSETSQPAQEVMPSTRQFPFLRHYIHYFAPTTNDPDYELGLISSILGLIAVFLVSVVVPYGGIKKVYYFSSVGMSVCLCLLSVSLFHFDNQSMQNVLNVLHVISVWCASFFISFGVATIPTSILGELFPHSAKGFACIPSIVFCMCSGIAVKIHPYLLLYCGGVLYVYYAILLLASTVFFALFVPETVGKSLDEIGHFFSGSNGFIQM
ncbi:uncharacterized protein LOC135841446 [Planococcus citri]|uniref:uncharacterized protein LOC135841446 n=1 Tax=Planococcus citri TaxID=170843 RepID=UPI0031F821FD